MMMMMMMVMMMMVMMMVVVVMMMMMRMTKQIFEHTPFENRRSPLPTPPLFRHP